MADRKFDIVLYGATGFTGRLVGEHLLKTYGAGRDVKWAMAGRNAGKLAQVRDLIGAPGTVATIVADAKDAGALAAMTAQAKVIVSTAGPYQLYGDELVSACAKNGTDYVDLTGESNWIAKMIGAHQIDAERSGARLVFSCGFDSIPFDCGVWYTEEEAKKRFGAYAPRVRGRLRAMKGGISGGTIASGMATQMAAARDASITALLADPFALTPGFRGAPQPALGEIYNDEVADSWVAPFMMAAINTKAVHRTNFLLAHPWGKNFQYDEMVMTSGPSATPDPGFAMTGPMPKPGEGPSKEERESGFYDIVFIAEYPDGRTLRCSVKGDRDPGYGSTSKMLGESAVCLLRDVPHAKTPGGCWTAAAAMDGALIARLQSHAGLTFAVET